MRLRGRFLGTCSFALATADRPGRSSSCDRRGRERSECAYSHSAGIGGKLTHPCQHGRILYGHPRSIAQCRSSHLDQRASPPLRQAPPRREHHLGTASRHAHHFFALISFITSISRSRSATSFFSRAFSASSCFSRRTSSAWNAPIRTRCLNRFARALMCGMCRLCGACQHRPEGEVIGPYIEPRENPLGKVIPNQARPPSYKLHEQQT